MPRTHLNLNVLIYLCNPCMPSARWEAGTVSLACGPVRSNTRAYAMPCIHSHRFTYVYIHTHSNHSEFRGVGDQCPAQRFVDQNSYRKNSFSNDNLAQPDCLLSIFQSTQIHICVSIPACILY